MTQLSRIAALKRGFVAISLVRLCCVAQPLSRVDFVFHARTGARWIRAVLTSQKQTSRVRYRKRLNVYQSFSPHRTKTAREDRRCPRFWRTAA
jgi:hypothetical protein